MTSQHQKTLFEDNKKETDSENLPLSMSQEEKVKIKREIKEKIRIWEKNRQALFDLAGLLYILKTNKNESVTSAGLFYRVLNNLEDPEITISYEGVSLLKTNRELSREIEQLAKQYSDVLPEVKKYFRKVRSKNIDGHLFNSYVVDENGNNTHWYDKPYNLIDSLISTNQIKWMKELLVSTIESNCRVEMLDRVIKSDKIDLNRLMNDENYFPDSIYPEIWDNDDYRDAKRNLKDIINELMFLWVYVKVFDDTEENKIARRIVSNNLAFLQKNNIIDFVKELSYNTDYGIVAVPAAILMKKDGIYYIGDFYDTESYQKLSPRIRKNTDKFLIHNIIERSCTDIDVLIKLKNFKVTDENIQEIIQALSNRHDNVPDWLIDKICRAIEKKPQTPKEYRKAKQYTAQIRDSFDSQKLEQQREELLLRLMNMNESLQEQVPGKKKIKDLHFRIK